MAPVLQYTTNSRTGCGFVGECVGVLNVASTWSALLASSSPSDGGHGSFG
jgi:hypothetical protein